MAVKMEAVGRMAGMESRARIQQFPSSRSSPWNLDIAREEYGRGADPLPELAKAREAADRAYMLTRQLLTFNRRDVAHSHLIHTSDTVRQLESMFTRVIGEQITVLTDLDPGTPPIRMERGDFEWQVVLNLIVNARDAMRDGGRLSISTRATRRPPMLGLGADGRDDEWFVLEIADTGVGMDEETQSHLFEPFFTTKPPDRGSGLGLSTIYGIVKSHGGACGCGECARARARYSVCTCPGRSQALEDAHVAGAVAPRGSETVLVVEDDPAVRDLARRLLVRQGYTVIEAASGEEALERFGERSSEIALILSDVVTPGMGGRALSATLQQRGVDTPMVFMSGYTDGAAPLRDAQGEVAPFLSKPFTSDELLTIVRRTIDGRGAVRR